MEVKDNTVSFVTKFSKSYANKKFSKAYNYYEITPSGNVQSEHPDHAKKKKITSWQCCKTISSQL